MNAVRARGAGGLEQLAYERAPLPTVLADDALVEVHAAAITRGELGWPDAWPSIPAHDLSGVVVEVGDEAEGVQVGDSVYGLIDFARPGAAAEFAAVRAADLAPRPETLDHVSAAAVPLPALTAWQALFDHAGLEPGQRVLVQGAAGSVGVYAVQLARWRGAHVVGTASAANLELVRDLGADEVVDYAASGLEDVGELDLVLDTVGGEALSRSLGLLRSGGRLVAVAEPAPEEAAAAAGVEATFFIVEPSRSQLVELGRLVDERRLRPVVRSVFPLEAARAAFEEVDGAHGGKVVLRVLD
jgi:NADPH:quinone reductase-like Zn-dependent oxidoreductase